MDDLRDVIRLEHLSIGFVDVAPKRCRFLAFLVPPAPPAPIRDLDELDDIFVWWLRRGYELERCLHRMGLGPEPAWLPADGEEDVFQDEIGYPCYDGMRLVTKEGEAATILPATFAALITAWLVAKPGRKLRLKVGSTETEVATVLAAEGLLHSASPAR